MRGGNSEGGEEFSIPVCDSRRWRWSREIPAFAGMGKGGGNGEVGGMGERGSRGGNKKNNKKISPHSRESGNLPLAGAGRATPGLHRFRLELRRGAEVGRFPLSREWGVFLFLLHSPPGKRRRVRLKLSCEFQPCLQGLAYV